MQSPRVLAILATSSHKAEILVNSLVLPQQLSDVPSTPGVQLGRQNVHVSGLISYVPLNDLKQLL
jgi:hypothetical protein